MNRLDGRMRAIRVHAREDVGSLACRDSTVPRMLAGDVLARVHAAGVTANELTWNSTFTHEDGSSRLPITPCFEFSGTVEASSPDSSDFSPGDDVYGLLNFWRDGAAAEYVAVKAYDIALKPVSVDHVRAAALPMSGLTAWQALFTHAKVQAGDRVLIHGAAGAVGTIAVQLARWCGAYVIGTASMECEAFLRDLGAAEVLDYRKVRFEEGIHRVDAVIDTIGGETLDRSWTVLGRDGALVTIAGDVDERRAARYGIRAVSMLVQPNREELIQLARLVDSGILRPIVDSTFPMGRARDAFERVARGHNRGKTVLRAVEPNPAENRSSANEPSTVSNGRAARRHMGRVESEGK